MKGDLAGLVRDLVLIESANPATHPGGSGEAAIARYCAGWLRRNRIAARVLLTGAGPDRRSVYAECGPGGGRRVLLAGHLDTYLWYPVPADTPALDPDTVRGPGASDMKGGVAAILHVMAWAARSLRRGSVVAVLTSDEEHASAGLRGLLPSLRYDAAVAVEDSGLDVGVCHDGSIGTVLRAALPVQRVRATAELLRYAVRHRVPGTELLRYTPVGAGMRIQRRLLPGEQAEPVRTGLLTQAPTMAALAGDWAERPALRVDLDDGWVRSLCDAAVAAGAPGRPVHLPGWTEAALLSAPGRPCLVFGPGGGGAHSTDEWCDIGRVRTSVGALTSAIHSYTNAT